MGMLAAVLGIEWRLKQTALVRGAEERVFPKGLFVLSALDAGDVPLAHENARIQGIFDLGRYRRMYVQPVLGLSRGRTVALAHT